MSPVAVLAGLAVAVTVAALRAAVALAPLGHAQARLHGVVAVRAGWPGWLPRTWAEVLGLAGFAPGRRAASALLGVAGALVLAVVAATGAVGGAIAAAGLVAAGPAAARQLRRRRDRRDADLLPLALEEVSRALRAGRSLRQAIAEAAARVPGAVGVELGQVARLAADGVALGEAVAWWREVRPVRPVRLACAALALCAREGGEPARAIDGVAATIRAEQALAGEVRAQSAQARLSAVCITMAPLLFTGLTCLSDPATAAFLLHSPAGWACLAVGLGLDVVAALWMRRILAARP